MQQRPTRRTGRIKAFAPDPEAPGQCCDHPGCEQQAGYRAPRGRDDLRSYYWFCLEHVRAYNANWDYYRGMTPGQIEAHLRADTSWQRPSWKLGNMGSAAKPDFTIDDLQDPLGILRGHGRTGTPPGNRNAPVHAPEFLRDSLAKLNIAWPTSLANIKARYRLLARKYHPDTNPDDQKAEEHFKSVGAAYKILRDYFNRSEA